MALALRFRCVAVLVFLLSSPSALPVVKVKAAALDLFTDKEALLSLKSQVTTDPSNTLFSWNNNSGPCNWTRVSCNQVNQRVVGLDLTYSSSNWCSKSLEILKLGGNKLWGTIPPSFANITSLLTLNLATNNLGGMIPDDFGRFKNLKHLDLSINNLTGNVPLSLYNISSLVFLAVASNQLRGEIPVDVRDRLPNLLSFNFCINKFTGSIPWSLHNLTNIKSIRLAHNLLSGYVPSGLGNLPELQMYNIGYNQIKSSGDEGLNFLTSFINSSYLNFLAIDGNLLEGLIPESIGNLSGSLRSVYLGGNRIYGRIPTSIRHLRSLALLNISYNYVSGEIPPEIGELTNLQELHLAANKISGRIPNSLGKLQKLNEIDLSTNDLVGSLPTTFVNFQQLVSMDLSSNRINGSIPKENFSLSSLRATLNLSSNQLTGSLPQEIKGLENVAAVDFSHNHLSGSIPDTIGSWKSLEKLFMENNMFSGVIPATLGVVKGLEILDLSSNQISGIIPNNLENLHALHLLNLSFNDLEGLLPKDGAFRNLSRIHVEGNSKLCLDLTCWNNQHRKRTSTAIYVVIASIATVAVCSVIAILLCRGADQQPLTCTGGLRGSIGYIPPAFPASIEQVVDPELFTGKSPTHECLITILGVGLSCTVDSPDRRTNMRESLLKLKTARDTLLKPPLDHKPDLDFEAGIGGSSM
ncbi:hypothetical protein POTOM_020515 [Populus tomentosa]|uniref:Leucine-rich repeat-containing N-terminal plant-type domain-containing protein n=1 Tax=Populus tomentosa TaxID=118781 RepID=A0A8X8D250_POPTO|nr:hypothetical protein POTOM_020515 [Populus tomentosa]